MIKKNSCENGKSHPTWTNLTNYSRLLVSPCWLIVYPRHPNTSWKGVLGMCLWSKYLLCLGLGLKKLNKMTTSPTSQKGLGGAWLITPAAIFPSLFIGLLRGGGPRGGGSLIFPNVPWKLHPHEFLFRTNNYPMMISWNFPWGIFFWGGEGWCCSLFPTKQWRILPFITRVRGSW